MGRHHPAVIVLCQASELRRVIRPPVYQRSLPSLDDRLDVVSRASIIVAIWVAPSRSPDTPEELSPSKNMRSPANDDTKTMMSDSYSVRHRVNWSSGGTRPST